MSGVCAVGPWKPEGPAVALNTSMMEKIFQVRFANSGRTRSRMHLSSRFFGVAAPEGIVR